jgi:hypothetical protein
MAKWYSLSQRRGFNRRIKRFSKAHDLAEFFEDEFLKLRKWCMCL